MIGLARSVVLGIVEILRFFYTAEPDELIAVLDRTVYFLVLVAAFFFIMKCVAAVLVLCL